MKLIRSRYLAIIHVHTVSTHIGVHSVVVALLSEKADIQYNPEQTDPDKLVREISSLGFEANLIADQDGYQQGKIDLIVSALKPHTHTHHTGTHNSCQTMGKWHEMHSRMPLSHGLTTSL